MTQLQKKCRSRSLELTSKAKWQRLTLIRTWVKWSITKTHLPTTLMHQASILTSAPLPSTSSFKMTAQTNSWLKENHWIRIHTFCSTKRFQRSPQRAKSQLFRTAKAIKFTRRTKTRAFFRRTRITGLSRMRTSTIALSHQTWWMETYFTKTCLRTRIEPEEEALRCSHLRSLESHQWTLSSPSLTAKMSMRRFYPPTGPSKRINSRINSWRQSDKGLWATASRRRLSLIAES